MAEWVWIRMVNLYCDAIHCEASTRLIQGNKVRYSKLDDRIYHPDLSCAENSLNEEGLREVRVVQRRTAISWLRKNESEKLEERFGEE